MIYAIITAAGIGSRFAGKLPKQLFPIHGKPLLAWALQPFLDRAEIGELIVTHPTDGSVEPFQELLKAIGETRTRLVPGGPTRYESVRRGFESIQNAAPSDPVLIHDAARPLLSAGLLARVLEGVKRDGTAVPVWPVQDTLKEVAGERILRTVPREKIRVAQTPQGFSYGILQAAYQIDVEPENVTDEAYLVELLGKPLFAIEGEKRNIKVTDQSDLAIVESYLSEAGH